MERMPAALFEEGILQNKGRGPHSLACVQLCSFQQEHTSACHFPKGNFSGIVAFIQGSLPSTFNVMRKQWGCLVSHCGGRLLTSSPGGENLNKVGIICLKMPLPGKTQKLYRVALGITGNCMGLL